jgi:hypothetical protein
MQQNTLGVLGKIKKGMFPFLIAFSALSVSASAAFYSVSGLSKLFAGASLEVIIMAGSLEFAKLVTASLLYQYWDTLNKTLRTYLSISTIVLVLITSMGIYGFLSAAYQETYSKLSTIENQKGFIQKKINFYQNDVNRYDEEIERISSNISTLSNAKASTIQVRDTSVSGGFRQTISTTELRMAQSRINIEEENRKLAQSKRSIASDSLQKFQLQVLDLDNNNEVAGELGPLQYLSNLTGTSMDKIINWLLLIIIFVFDPLAISLVVAANFAFDKAYPKKQYRENLYGEEVEVLSPRDISKIVKENENSSPPNEDLTKAAMEFEVKDAEEMQTQEEFLENLNKLEKIKDWEAAERRMEIIGQNGNNGEHYEDIPKELSWLDLDGDGFISQVELKDAYKNISKLEKILKSDISKDKQKYILNLINEIKKRIKSDDTKTY